MVKSERLSSTHSNSLLSKPVKVIAISAGKGGVGKTNIALNLAILLSEKSKKVLLLDADLGLANIDIMLGVSAKFNLYHVLQGNMRLAEIMLTGPYGLKIVPAASGTDYMTELSATQHAGIINAFNELTEEFDYMIIDTAAGISDTVLSFTRSSQEVVVVICDEPTSLTDSYALIKVMNKRYNWSHFRILTNMVRDMRAGRELFNRLYRVAEQFLDISLDYLGAIPFDEHVHDAIKKQTPLAIAFPTCKATKALLSLVKNVEEWPVKKSLGGNTSFFLERMVAHGGNQKYL